MMKPTRKQPQPCAWTPFAEALMAGAACTRRQDQLASMEAACRGVLPPGEIRCAFVDDADASVVSLAGESATIEIRGRTRARLTWAGPADRREQARAILAEAAERLGPLVAAWEAIRRVSGMDPLTGAGNRRALDEQLGQRLSLTHRHRIPLSVLMLDADRFKAINDTRGHAAGDRALIELATWLKGVVRKEDQLFRVGGDEFILLLPHTDPAGTGRLAERIHAGAPIPVSIGTATATGQDTAASLIQRADEALLRNKRRPSLG